MKIFFSLDLIEDTRALAKKMSVSAAASINFGFSGGEGKAKFLAESEMNQSSVFALTSIRVRNAPKFVANAKLATDAADTLRANPDRFRSRCGDGFISSITSGAEYFGIIEIATTSEAEKQEIKAEINAHHGSWSAQAEFESAINASTTNKRVHVRTYQAGGDQHNGRPCRDVACILERAAEMPDAAATHPDLVEA